MKKYSEIPGPKLNLIIKGSDALQNTPFEYLTELNELYPDIARLKAVHLDIVQITNPDYIRQVLQTDQKNYTKSVQYEQLKLILGEGLVTSEGDMWKKQRKLIQPAFHRQQIASFFDIMVDCTNEMLNEWKVAPNSTIDLSEHMMKITLQIIGKTMLSKDVKSTSTEVDKALTFIIRAVNKRTMKALNLPMWLPLPKHLEFEKNVKVLDKIIYDIINERKIHGHGNGDLLDMLMQSKYEDTGEPMPDKLLKDEVMTIFLAGHETTANALSWTMYLLSQNPECIKKIRAEVDRVTQGEEITLAHLQQLEYTRACLSEGMRIYPPVWLIARKAIVDTSLGEYEIPAGTNVFITPFLVHMREDLWDKPEEFWPERWFTDEVKKMDKFAYFPFAAGPRMCIGNTFALMESELILAKMIQAFDFEYLSNVAPEKDPTVTLRVKNEIPMKLTPIKTQIAAKA